MDYAIDFSDGKINECGGNSRDQILKSEAGCKISLNPLAFEVRPEHFSQGVDKVSFLN